MIIRLEGWADGQLSKFVEVGTAINPFNWHRTAYGITIDRPYRYTRIGYSVLAWLLSGGGHAAALPFILVLVNLLSVAGIAWLGGLLARSAGRHALWGLLFAAYFGLVVSIGRDTSEPLADLCLLGGLLSYRQRRFVLAALLLSYAAFANEPVLVFPLALSLTRWWQVWRNSARPGLPDLAWVLPGFLYVLLQGIQQVVVGGVMGGLADASANLTWPFTALAAGVYRDVSWMSWSHLGTYDYNLLEFTVVTAFIVAACAVIRSTTAPAHERVAFAGFVVLELVLASSQFSYSVFGEGRTFIDAYLMAVVLLLGAGRTIRNRHLAVLAIVILLALVLVARRRILFQ